MPAMPIETRTDTVVVADGSFAAHVALPERGEGPGILLLQEIFGVAPYIIAVAERLAAMGYVVVAPGAHPGIIFSRQELPALRVDLFLDGEEEDEAGIMDNLAEAAETARRRGWALVICHPRPETLAALQTMLPRLTDYGLRFVTVPALFAALDASDPAPPPPRRTGPH